MATYTFRPTINGVSVELAPSSGTTPNAYQMVDESSQDSDTTYLKEPGGNLGNLLALFSSNFEALENIGTINSITVYFVSKHTGTSTNFRVRAIMRDSGGTNRTGTQETLTGSYATYSHVFSTNLPSSGVDLLDYEFGVEHVVTAGNFQTGDKQRTTQVYAVVDYEPISMSSLRDDFNDNSLDTGLWSGTNAAETNQRIELSTPAFDSSSLISNAYYDLTGTYIGLELVSAGTMSVFRISYPLQIESFGAGSTYLALFYEIWDNSIRLYKYTEAAGSVLQASQTYNSTSHRWLRFREASGTMYAEYGSDGRNWSNFASFAVGSLNIEAMRLVVADINNSSGTYQMFIDNVNDFTLLVSAHPVATATLSATPHVTYHPSISFSGTAALTAAASNLEDQSSVEKTYLYKVYDTEDNFLGVWQDVMSDFSYSHEINSAGSAIQVELARNSDSRIVTLDDLITTQSSESITTQDSNTLVVASETANNIGPGTDVDVNYRVEIWAFFGQITELETTSGELILTQASESIMVNSGSVNGRRKFNGYITRYVSRYGSTETVQVSIASFGAELDNYVLENGSDTTVSYLSQDPGTIVRDSLDLFNAAGGLVSYSNNTVDLTSTVVSYTFRVNTYLEMLEKAIELAPYDWFYYVDLGEDLVYFTSKPSTPAHYFVLGQHIEELNLEYSIEEITNLVYFTGGETAGVNLFKKYEDATSITNYRQGLQRISDHRVTLDASADLISEAEIERNTAPRYRSSITILDSTYEVEEIMLGQVIGFRNFGNYIDDLTMQIVRIDYEPDRVTLQLDTLLPSVNKRIEDLTRNLEELENVNTPDAPS